jgi:hypothetical protein
MEATQAMVENGAISADLRRELVSVADQYSISPVEALVLARRVDPAVVARAIATCAHVPLWLKWPPMAISRATRHRLPAELAYEHRVVPLEQDADGDLTVAMADPLDDEACREVEFFAGSRIIRLTVPVTLASGGVFAFYGLETPFLSMWRKLAEIGDHPYALAAST